MSEFKRTNWRDMDCDDQSRRSDADGDTEDDTVDDSEDDAEDDEGDADYVEGDRAGVEDLVYDDVIKCPDCNRNFLGEVVDGNTSGDPSVLNICKYSGCSYCHKNLLEHFRRLFDRNNELGVHLKRQEKKTVQHMANEAFLRFHRPVNVQSDKLLKAGDIVKIFVNDDANPILAHTFILAKRSRVFRLIFENQVVQEECRVLWFRFPRRAVIEAVIDFCYKAEITFTAKGLKVTPKEVLMVAHRCKIPHLMKTCDEKLAAGIYAHNLLDMMKLAMTFDIPMTKAAVSKHVKEDFDRCFPIVMFGYKQH